MGRILAIDYGTKRVGLAASDPLQIIASPLDTVPTKEIWDYLANYMFTEEVEAFVVGEPLYPDGNPSQITPVVEKFVKKLGEKYPQTPIYRQDESYSSEDAKQIILQSGIKKKKRRDKNLVDKIAAVLILQRYLGHI